MLNISVSIYELMDTSLAVKTHLVTGTVLPIYSKYGIGLPLLMTPILFFNDLMHKVFTDFNSLIPLAFPNIIVLAVTAQVLFLIITDMGYGYTKGLLLALLAVFGTFALPYINFFFSEPLQALMITTTFFLLYRARSAKDPLTAYGLLAGGGVAFCYAVLTKAAVLILLPSFALYVLFCIKDKGRKKAFASAVSFSLPVIIFGFITAYLNYRHFGSIFDFGYGSEAMLFTTPVTEGLKNLLFNPNKSVLIFAPFSVLFPYACWRFAGRFRAETLLIISLVAINLLFYATWWAWEGGESWGPRFLLPLLPLSVVPLAELQKKRFFNVLTILLFIAGFMVNILPILQDSNAYNYIVLESTRGIELDTSRPRRDYLDGKKQAPPHVTSSTIGEFNVISGNLWLLRARYKGWLNGYGVSAENPLLRTPPWIKKYPQYTPPDIESLPLEIRIRLACPTPILLSILVCPGKRPSAPYYYDALMAQAEKAEALGRIDDALRLRKKALREIDEKTRRARQMGTL